MSRHSLNDDSHSMTAFYDFIVIFLFSACAPKVAAFFSMELAETLFRSFMGVMAASYVRAYKDYNKMFIDYIRSVYRYFKNKRKFK